MPLYRYRCSCSHEREEIGKHDEAGPRHCGAPMQRLMGRPSSIRIGATIGDQVQAEQTRAAADKPPLKITQHAERPTPPPGLADVPPCPNTPLFRKSWGECSGAEKTARRRDTVQAMTAMQKGALEASGIPAPSAGARASEYQQSAMARAVEAEQA